MPFWVNTIDPRRHSSVNIVWPRGRFRVRVLRYAAPLLRRRPRMPSICSASMWSLSRARAQVRFLRVWGTFENFPPGRAGTLSTRATQAPPFSGRSQRAPRTTRQRTASRCHSTLLRTLDSTCSRPVSLGRIITWSPRAPPLPCREWCRPSHPWECRGCRALGFRPRRRRSDSGYGR